MISALLGAHSKIFSPPEPWFLLPLAGVINPVGPSFYSESLAKKGTMDFIGEDLFINASRQFALEVYNTRLAQSGAELLVDKTPRYYHILDFIDAMFPDAKKIWLKRNPLDVALSYRESWGVPISTLVGENLDESSFDLTIGFDALVKYFEKKSDKKIAVSYEKLVNNPVEELTALCAFLGIAFESGQLAFMDSKWGKDARKSDLGDNKIFKTSGVHGKSVGGWRTSFGAEEIRELINAIGVEALSRAGYADITNTAERFGPFASTQNTLALHERLRMEFARKFQSTLREKEDVILGQQRIIAQKDQDILNIKRAVLANATSGAAMPGDNYRQGDQPETPPSPGWQHMMAWLHRIFVPRLGSLFHYSTRSLVIPSWYYTTTPPAVPPAITIVTPSYNQAEFIQRTIESVLSQNYSNLEYIVQDGNSKDGTVAVLEKYSHFLSRYVSEKDAGQSDAINKGFNGTHGEIMAYLNSDDMLLPGALNYVATFFSKHPEVDVVYGHRVIVDENDMEIGRWVMPPHSDDVLKWADYIPQETMFWRRSIWEKAGGRISTEMDFAMDWDLILRFIEQKARIKRLPRFLGVFRVHGKQKTTATIDSEGMHEMNKLRGRIHGRQVSNAEVANAIRPYLIRHIAFQKLYRAGILKY